MERMNEVLNRRSYIRNLVQSVQKELAEGLVQSEAWDARLASISAPPTA